MNKRPRAPEDALISRRILILSNLLRRAASLRYRRLLDISVGEWGAIAELGVRAPCTLNELTDGLALDKTRLSRTLSSLSRRGLVQRRVNPNDKRAPLISLTSAGKKAHATILASAAVANDRLMQGMSRGERETIIKAIDGLTEKARAALRMEHGQEAGDAAEPTDDLNP